MDQLHLINVFVAVANAGSLAGAARTLGVSPPAVTRAVNELESRLGVRLLTRTTRVVRLTEPGARYAEDCRRVLADLAQANASATGSHGTPSGRLTLTAPVLFGARFVTPIVTEYLRLYPAVDAACWFLDRIVNMTEEGVDVAIRIGDLPDSSLQAVRVGSVRRVICAAPAYLAQHGTPTDPDALAAHTIIDANAQRQTCTWRLRNDGAPLVVKLQARLTATTNDAARAAAVDGFGITRLLSYQITDQLQRGQLAIVLAEYEPPAWPIHLVHREGRHVSPRVRSFMDLAIDRLRAHPALR